MTHTSRFVTRLLEAYQPKGKENSSSNPIINLNDIVVVRNEQEKRTFWKIGKVIKLIVGNDGSTRSAQVEVSSKNGKTVLKRSLKHLVPLEIRSQSSQSDTQQQQAPPQQQAPQQQQAQPPAPATLESSRPRRKAAVVGELIRKNNVI
eukprot:gene16278-biopygen13832